MYQHQCNTDRGCYGYKLHPHIMWVRVIRKNCAGVFCDSWTWVECACAVCVCVCVFRDPCMCDCVTCDVCVGGGGEFVVTERTHIHTAPVTLLAHLRSLAQVLTKRSQLPHSWKMNGAGMAVAMGQARMDGKQYRFSRQYVWARNLNTSNHPCSHAYQYGDGSAALRRTAAAAAGNAAPPSLSTTATASPFAGADALHWQHEQRSILSRNQYLRFGHPSSKHRCRWVVQSP